MIALARLPEARRATHDGHIWPQPRAAMTQRAEIITRMSQDFRTIAEEQGGCVDIAYLLPLGWLTSQVSAHAVAAANRYAADKAARETAHALENFDRESGASI